MIEPEEWDIVSLTGKITSEPGCPHVIELYGVVATVNEDAIKVWPVNENDDQLPPDSNGKLWFDRKASAVRIISKGFV